MANVIDLARKSSQQQIEAIHKGLPAKTFPDIATYLGVTQERLAAHLHIEARTMRKRQASGERLNRQESEKSLRVARVIAMGCDVLGNRKSATEWMISPIKSLGNQRPIDLLDTDIGTQDVLNVLQAIKWGVYL